MSANLEDLAKRIRQLDRRSFILTPEGNGVQAVKDRYGQWVNLHEVIALLEAAIEHAVSGYPVDARRDAFMAGRQSVRGINRAYSERAWQAYLATLASPEALPSTKGLAAASPFQTEEAKDAEP